jgi:acylphosphatase
VGYRYFAHDTARHLGLTGWVRNRWDGAVETVAEGERPGLEAYLEALTRGPRGARVEHVESEWLDASGEFEAFGVRLL